jgi:tetratricopeptide (TPR) repeat protein
VKRAPKAALFSLVGLLAVLALAACSEATPTAMPSSILDHFKRGNELSQNGQFEEAAAEYRLALDGDPENVDVLANLGVALYNLGQLDEAIELYQKATESTSRQSSSTLSWLRPILAWAWSTRCWAATKTPSRLLRSSKTWIRARMQWPRRWPKSI